MWVETLFTHDCFHMKPTITSIYLQNITQKQQYAYFVYNINSCPPKPNCIWWWPLLQNAKYLLIGSRTTMSECYVCQQAIKNPSSWVKLRGSCIRFSWWTKMPTSLINNDKIWILKHQEGSWLHRTCLPFFLGFSSSGGGGGGSGGFGSSSTIGGQLSGSGGLTSSGGGGGAGCMLHQ